MKTYSEFAVRSRHAAKREAETTNGHFALLAADSGEQRTQSGSSGIYRSAASRVGSDVSGPADSRTVQGRALARLPRNGQIATAYLFGLWSAAALAVHWVWHTETGLVFVALSPLLLLTRQGSNAHWPLRALAMWLLLAAAELAYPLASQGMQPHRFLSVLVLAFVLQRLHAAYAGMQELSRRDPLTGLLNRRGFEEAARRELQRAHRYARPIAFALLDVDRFKEVNDQLGHVTGDRVLQIVAAQLRELRASDLAVRLGGDEFGVLMPETDAAGAALLMERLRQRVHDELHANGWPVTVSVGIAEGRAKKRALAMETLMIEADRRMYQAKSLEHARAARNAF